MIYIIVLILRCIKLRNFYHCQINFLLTISKNLCLRFHKPRFKEDKCLNLGLWLKPRFQIVNLGLSKNLSLRFHKPKFKP